ncbi:MULTISPECIES: FlgB family protein [Rhodobacterales]|uniref:FlgB family protein n=1 Tax=Rhodobacterales TaxID=204455 RepID=UPI00080076C0|nr:FlgB family protein [Marivivens sp. JLT3646]APO88160.1 flagellar biosynthesis protein FlgB [Marivivens sp. JLT3646]OBR35452.1 flagellar biosynthesis protein FlgB [Donghicola sp. JL3646]
MYENMKIFSMAGQVAAHAGARQAVTAQNIANADTPGYKAQSIAPFAKAYEEAGTPVRTTRAGHLSTGGLDAAFAISDRTTEQSPNGNSVSLEEEMVAAVDASREHNRALAVYRHGMTVLRTALGRS